MSSLLLDSHIEIRKSRRFACIPSIRFIVIRGLRNFSLFTTSPSMSPELIHILPSLIWYSWYIVVSPFFRTWILLLHSRILFSVLAGSTKACPEPDPSQRFNMSHVYRFWALRHPFFCPWHAMVLEYRTSSTKYRNYTSHPMICLILRSAWLHVSQTLHFLSKCSEILTSRILLVRTTSSGSHALTTTETTQVLLTAYCP